MHGLLLAVTPVGCPTAGQTLRTSVSVVFIASSAGFIASSSWSPSPIVPAPSSPRYRHLYELQSGSTALLSTRDGEHSCAHADAYELLWDLDKLVSAAGLGMTGLNSV
jgi:hypothetical protein